MLPDIGSPGRTQPSLAGWGPARKLRSKTLWHRSAGRSWSCSALVEDLFHLRWNESDIEVVLVPLPQRARPTCEAGGSQSQSGPRPEPRA
jgi:hypothetical protein